MDFGNILSRAWHITWKNRALWLFGILASCGRQGGYSGSGFNFSSSSQIAPPGTLPPDVERFFFQLERNLENISPEVVFSIALAVFALALLLTLLFSFFTVFGRVTVIKGTLMADAGSSLRTGSLAREGYTYFWRAFGLNLLLGFAMFVVMGIFVLGGVLFSMVTLGIGALCFIPLICLLIPLSLLYTVYIQMANVALVSEDLDVLEAASRGWEVMQGNWGNIILMGLILMIGGGLLGVLITLPIIFVAAPLMFAAISGNRDLISSGLAISGICLVVGIPVLILANGILRTFLEGAWTLTYQELAAEKEVA